MEKLSPGAVPGKGITTTEGDPLGKEPIMAYKKPQMVAKSSAKKSYVAGCPEKTPFSSSCHCTNMKCMCGPLN